MKYKIGYTAGAFDLLHVGHIRHLKLAKLKCDYLIVGVSTDEFIISIKNKKSVYPLEERMEIINSLKCVDSVIVQDSINKMSVWHKYKFDVMFSGDDWKGNERYKNYEKQLKDVGCDLVFLPYTQNISTSKIVNLLNIQGDLN